MKALALLVAAIIAAVSAFGGVASFSEAATEAECGAQPQNLEVWEGVFEGDPAIRSELQITETRFTDTPHGLREMKAPITLRVCMTMPESGGNPLYPDWATSHEFGCAHARVLHRDGVVYEVVYLGPAEC